MTLTDANGNASDTERRRLGADLDVEICIVGAGLAGLTIALETARAGYNVVVLEARTIGWGASGHQLGTVMPGYDLPIDDLLGRVGLAATSELWKLSQAGGDYIRRIAADPALPALAVTDGTLEVSTVDVGDRLIARMQLLNDDFGIDAEGWQIERVRDVLRTRRYFHAVHYPRGFQLDGRAYLMRLAALARQAGVRIFEDTPVIGLDASGIRKRIVTPSAKLRAAQVVLAGNVHLGTAVPRLAATLLPVWRHAAITAPLGEKLHQVIGFKGSVVDSDGIDHFRVVDGDRLMWVGPETTWDAPAKRFAGPIRRRIRSIFPALGTVAIETTWGGAVGQTVHQMPQIGQLRKGLWIASGFSRQGLNTSAMAGQLVARGIDINDDQWRLFSPFELVWAGGPTGRVAGQVIGLWTRGRAAAAGAFARYREGAKVREVKRAEKREAANREIARRVRLSKQSERRDDQSV
jgi:glycine/D-amino acid oxidase-like deaminating enzyme